MAREIRFGLPARQLFYAIANREAAAIRSKLKPSHRSGMTVANREAAAIRNSSGDGSSVDADRRFSAQ